MANTAFSVLYGAVLTKLGLADTASTAKAKVCVNDAVREIINEADWPFINDLNNFIAGTGARAYTVADSDYEQPEMVVVADQVTKGDSSTTIAVTGTITTTFTYTGVGTNPYIGIGYQEVGDTITSTDFVNGNNNASHQVITVVGTNYVTTGHAATAETKVGPVIKMTCRGAGNKARRTGRKQTIISPDTVTEYTYCVPTLRVIEFNYPIVSTQGIFYDYKKVYTSLSGDGDACLLGPSYDHLVVYLALALLLELNDDTRATNAYAKYRVELQKMKRRYLYNDDMEVTMKQGGSLSD